LCVSIKSKAINQCQIKAVYKTKNCLNLLKIIIMKTIYKMKNNDSESRFFTSIKLVVVTVLALFASACSDDEACDYTSPTDTFPFSCDSGMDVAFLIDYTGSMGEAIEGIKSSISSIATSIVTESGGDYRLSLSVFDEVTAGTTPSYNTQVGYTNLPAAQKQIITSGTTTAQYLTMMEPFATANQTTFSTQLANLNSANMSLGSGNGFAEPGALLLDQILNNNFSGSWRTGITKLVFIITDAPAGGDDDINTAIDDAFLNGLATQANLDNVQLVLVSTLASSNYELELINNNILGDKMIVPNFNNIAENIITLIENICDGNEE
tara:strand:- start:277781 stop:278749 length:969 start_codon:yes stop_codon:yes gene_type:complete